MLSTAHASLSVAARMLAKQTAGGCSGAAALLTACLVLAAVAAQPTYKCGSKSIEWSGQLGNKQRMGTLKVCWDKVRPPNASVVQVDVTVSKVGSYSGFGIRGRSSTTETGPSSNPDDFYRLDHPNEIKDNVKTYSFYQELKFPSGIDAKLLAAFTAGCNPPDAGAFQRTLMVSGVMTTTNSTEKVEESVGFKRKGKCD